MGLTLVIDEIIAEERTYKYNKTLRVVDPNKAEVTMVYFAKKEISFVDEKDGTHPYTFTEKKDTSTSVKKSEVAGKIQTEIKPTLDGQNKRVKLQDIIDKLTENSYDSTSESIEFDVYKKEQKKEVRYKKIETEAIGNQAYLIVETKELNGKKVKVKIHEKDNEFKILKDKEALLPVLVYAKKEDKTTDTEASDWIEIDIKKEKGKKDGSNILLTEGSNEIEVGIKKIQLRPKKDKMANNTEEASKSFEGWAEKLYIRYDESEEGKAAKATRDAEGLTTLTPDSSLTAVSYPKEISGPKSINLGEEAVYILDKYSSTNATTADKHNIQWSLFVQGTNTNSYTTITSKSKANLYTYAKMELVDTISTIDSNGMEVITGGKNKLTIVFDKALKGKKIQIEPFRGTPNINNSKNYVRTTTVNEFKINKLDTTQFWLQINCDDCKEGEKDKEFLKSSFFKLKTPDTIHVYSDGKMSKVNFKNLLFGKKLKYVYVDKDGDQHAVCECEIYETWKMGTGNSSNSFMPSATEKAAATVTDYAAMNITGVNAHKTWLLTNNNIYTEGDLIAGYTHLHYKASSEKIIMVAMPSNGLKYKKGKIIIKFGFKRTLRKYSSPEVFAAFIGILGNTSYEDTISEGSSYKNGGSYPSKTHNNGFAIDTWYFGPNRDPDKGFVTSLNLTKQQAFMDAFKKFNFTQRIKGTQSKYSNLDKHTSKNSHHNGHLHCGILVPNYK